MRVSPLSIDFLGGVAGVEVEAGFEVAAEARAARARIGLRGAWECLSLVSAGTSYT